MKHLFALLIFLLPVIATAQSRDTITIMTYNTLNYGRPATNSCPALITGNKHRWLKTIIDYTKPDILGLVKMASDPPKFGRDTVLQKVLNADCPGCYGASPYINITGYNRTATLYYRTDKFGYLGIQSVYTADDQIEDVNMHRLYYKDPLLAQTRDTVYLNIILHRLQSNSGGGERDRNTEAAGISSWISGRMNPLKNHIIMGDFNSTGANEKCISLFTSPANAALRFNDPANALGQWAANPQAYASLLTQSTRTSDPGDCGSEGGMGDRLDHILLSDTLMYGRNNRINYVPNSFKVIGNDGRHTLMALTDPPSNNSAPANVISALYNMSNHLPVVLKMSVRGSVLSGTKAQLSGAGYNMQSQGYGQLKFSLPASENPESYNLKICGTDGRIVLSGPLHQSSSGAEFNMEGLQSGIYFCVLSVGGQMKSVFKTIRLY
ncbi:MAG: hypothetical protein V4543_13040 [Bacteroidota bacterium]